MCTPHSERGERRKEPGKQHCHEFTVRTCCEDLEGELWAGGLQTQPESIHVNPGETTALLSSGCWQCWGLNRALRAPGRRVSADPLCVVFQPESEALSPH